MVRLTLDVIARGTSGYAKKKRDESMNHYLKRLTHLYLEDRNIDEVGDDFTMCRNLMVLYIYDNKLSQVPNLNGNGNLTHLYLQNNNIRRMDGLNGLFKLTKLYMGGNCITVVEALDKLSTLQELHLENQKIPSGEKLLFDPRTLASLAQSLQVLNVSGNGLDSVRDLAGLRLVTQFMASDNLLTDLKELAAVLGTWHGLWRVDLAGNPLSHKAKYRDRVIIMAPSLEVMDGKEVTETAKKFLQNWQASREAHKRKMESNSRQNTAFSQMAPTGEGDRHPSHTHSYSHSQTTAVANRLGNEVPGYIMPALPRKQFQEVLAKSASQPHTGLTGHTKSYSEFSTAPRYSMSMNFAYFYANRPKY